MPPGHFELYLHFYHDHYMPLYWHCYFLLSWFDVMANAFIFAVESNKYSFDPNRRILAALIGNSHVKNRFRKHLDWFLFWIFSSIFPQCIFPLFIHT